jgi:nudix-type nucleoside diphosphatase (YffH/AdpP family)
VSARSDGRVQIKSQELLGGGWARLMRYVVDVRRKDGEVQQIVREVEDHGNSVAVLPFDPERQTVLLSRQFRLAAHLNDHDGWLIEVCAGMIDGGETPEEAIRREAREELGIVLRDLRRVHDIFVSPGASKERATLFSAHYSPRDRISEGGGADDSEDIEVLEMTLADAARAVADASIVDAKTIILVQAALLAAADKF